MMATYSNNNIPNAGVGMEEIVKEVKEENDARFRRIEESWVRIMKAIRAERISVLKELRPVYLERFHIFCFLDAIIVRFERMPTIQIPNEVSKPSRGSRPSRGIRVSGGIRLPLLTKTSGQTVYCINLTFSDN
ncbi:hypothetical protein VNO80_07576 [Phaseolus coccineus]|uniref:Uncharacterized protein n=1 Tax=Phaseolus coccineus TaxID=3886 RepID=A0AAN9RFH8_PHACN